MRSRDHLDEDLLRHLFGGRPVGQHPVTEPEERRRISLEQLRRAVGVAAADPLEKARVLQL
jgi:hypothetical protein